MEPADYLAWRDKLAALWQNDTRPLSHLSPQEQWNLHGYFQFHREKSRAEALQYLAEIQANRPEVEHQGLAALDRLRAIAEAVAAGRNPGGGFTYDMPSKGRSRGRRLTIFPVVQPEIDVQKLARAVIALARQQLEEAGDLAPVDDGHIRGRCDATADGSHPDLTAYRRSRKPQPQINRFLQCCRLAVDEVRKGHMSIAAAAKDLARASECQAIVTQPVVAALVELAARVRDASSSLEAEQAWRRFTENLSMVTQLRL